jgi:hypothetical protein
MMQCFVKFYLLALCRIYALRIPGEKALLLSKFLMNSYPAVIIDEQKKKEEQQNFPASALKLHFRKLHGKAKYLL